MIYECKKFLDTNIYRSFNLLSNQYAIFFRNFERGYKESIGVQIDNMIGNCILNMSMSYRSKDNNVKLNYANLTLDELYKLEIQLKRLYESYKCINDRQFACLCQYCGKIEEQLDKWINKLTNNN